MMDIWRSGFVRAPLTDVLASGSLDPFEVEWLPGGDSRFAFLADPFGVVRGGMTYVFVEALDYRDRRGRIEVLTFDSDMVLVDRSTCLSEPWHLSYPVPIEWRGEDFLLPESHRSGGLTLYRATQFPERWEPAARIALPDVPVDATPIWHDGLWWIFYSPAGDTKGQLLVAFGEELTGPWRAHPANPVRTGLSGSRPAGRPVELGTQIILPVQDCSRTYGGAVRPLHIHRLTPDAFEAELGAAIEAPPAFAPYTDGLHTLSECGPITLFDVKRIDRSLAGQVVGLIGKVRRRAGRSRTRSPGTGPG
jgi:hypothetical protein